MSDPLFPQSVRPSRLSMSKGRERVIGLMGHVNFTHLHQEPARACFARVTHFNSGSALSRLWHVDSIHSESSFIFFLLKFVQISLIQWPTLFIYIFMGHGFGFMTSEAPLDTSSPNLPHVICLKTVLMSVAMTPGEVQSLPNCTEAPFPRLHCIWQPDGFISLSLFCLSSFLLLFIQDGASSSSPLVLSLALWFLVLDEM